MTEALNSKSNQLADAELDVGVIRPDEPLANHSTWRVGGPADYLVEPQSIAQLCRLMQWLHKRKLPHVVIGKGSNLLFPDKGVRGVVIKIDRGLRHVQQRGNQLLVEAGISVPRLAHYAGSLGLSGLEHTIGIPGTLGGLVVMNGGSLRHSVSEVIDSVDYIDARGQLMTRQPDQCEFDYRRSWFQGNFGIVVRACLNLTPGDRHRIMQTMIATLRQRRANFPLRYPNCGSVFKSNPTLYERGGPPGKVIESLGLKGTQIGGAAISQRHANFIINRGTARACDILQLIALVRDQVREHFDLALNCEVKYVSEQGEVMAAHLAC
jgi:UDP-N-acetylmuramate dehydrogenase